MLLSSMTEVNDMKILLKFILNLLLIVVLAVFGLLSWLSTTE